MEKKDDSMKNIVKPLTVTRYEFISALAKLINNSGLPPFILESILKDFYSDVKLLAQKNLEEDLKRYADAKGADKS